MKTKELIDLLIEMESGTNPDVYIHDSDTGWFLPLRIGRLEHDGNQWHESPINSIIVFGDYSERVRTPTNFDRKAGDK